ncbi:hypothetical protein BGZ68_007352 [Mortierella alpina]|nr:hypothetical protein BGZ68_007352 [Mortierella alpina]
MKSLNVLRRRHLILLVPVVNFIFLFLYVVSPTSLPRLPQFLSRSRGLTDELPYLWDLRKQVEGFILTPLPDHLITTYRPKHLQYENQEDTDDIKAQEAIDRDNSTKYLTFLPHSGFHNQRTELENALLLARLLNRTLIMPKVYLGPPMPWLEFRHLHSRLLYQTKIGLDHCRAIIEYKELDVVNPAYTRPPPTQPSPQPSSDSSQQQEAPLQQQDQQHYQQPPVMHHHHQFGMPPVPFIFETPEQHAAAIKAEAEAGQAVLVDTQPLSPADIQIADSETITNDAGQDSTQEMNDKGDQAMEMEDDFEEEEVPSWIEESDRDEVDKIRVATGDRILDFEEDDDASDRDPDDWENMEEGEEGGYEEDDDLLGSRVGIMDTEGDDDDLEPDWRPEVYTLPNYLQEQYQNRPECLQYESWTMTDWDLFFDLNPLRRYVRVLTRESISMEYLGTQFGLEMPKEEDPPSNSTDLSSNSTESGYPFNSTDFASPTFSFDIVPLPSPIELLPSNALGLDSGEGIGSDSSESASKSSDDDKDKDDDNDKDDDKDKDDEDDKEKEEDNSAPDDDTDTDDDERKRPLLRSEGDVLFFDDANLYDYRFTEDPKSAESKKTRSKYLEEFTVDWLAQRPERLIHLGSIFGSGRVIIETLQSKAWLQMIRDHLIIRTDILQTTSQRIVDKIRADDRTDNEPLMQDPLEAGFVGVHIRMSDGHFSLSARDTIENIRQELMWQMGMTDGQPRVNASDPAPFLEDDVGSRPRRHERLSIEQCRARAISHRRLLHVQLARLEERRQQYLEQQRLQQEQQQQQQQQQQQYGHQHEPSAEKHYGSPPLQQFEQHTLLRPVPETPGRRSNGRFTPIYLATDAHYPRSNPIFNRLFETFECIFTLDDFAEDLEELKRFRNPEDGTLMTKFLIPMVDAMVVAKAGAFFGTPASTFSTYIQKQLRPAYTGLYD